MRILTFDIEEWFHILDNESTRTHREWSQYESRIESNVERVLELLLKKKKKATFFCLGWIAEKYPNIIKKIDTLGYKVASHSYSHQLVYEQSEKEFRDDLSRSVKILEDLTGKKVRAYRAPGFSLRFWSGWFFDALADNGIEIDCSIFPARRAHGGFKDFYWSRPVLIVQNGIQIKEFPINTYRLFGNRIIFSGGGYFRLLPYCIIKRLTDRSDYVMTYFHPRDFDKAQPVIKELSLFRRFKSYYGLSSAMSKLEALLDHFDFVDLDEADKEINWNLCRKINLNSEEFNRR